MTTASRVATWTAMSNASPSTSNPKTVLRARKWALDEIGKNSVTPWTAPTIAAFKTSGTWFPSIFLVDARKLRSYRETYLLAQGMTYREVALKLGWLEGDKDYYLNKHKWIADDGLEYTGMPVTEYQLVLDNRVKKVKRHVQQVETIFDSIERGTFP